MILYLDTETIPSLRPEVFAWLAAKHFVIDEVEKSAKKAAEAHAKTSLTGSLGELVCISWAVDECEPQMVVRDMASAEGERKMLVDFLGKMNSLNPANVVAFNAEFDRNMIRQRAIVHGVRLPAVFSAVGVKPWESKWRCPMEMWTDDRRGKISLDELCLAFGLPGKNGFDGSMVAEMVRNMRLDEVANYCADDVRRVRAVYQRMVSV
jgi:predicted PolB exonuclease-like 3'-5' exonuclease